MITCDYCGHFSSEEFGKVENYQAKLPYPPERLPDIDLCPGCACLLVSRIVNEIKCFYQEGHTRISQDASANN